jgi:replicative superfamily II helicase
VVDSLNAEIALGTVANVDEGVRWIGWTYLFVRLRRNPMVYGVSVAEVEEDPSLGSKRHLLITTAARRLAEANMIVFDQDLGTLVPTDLGRIASKYYLRHASIEIFNKTFRPKLTEADILGVISSSVEFSQIMVRESEAKELGQLLEQAAPCEVKVGRTAFIMLEAMLTVVVGRVVSTVRPGKSTCSYRPIYRARSLKISLSCPTCPTSLRTRAVLLGHWSRSASAASGQRPHG